MDVSLDFKSAWGLRSVPTSAWGDCVPISAWTGRINGVVAATLVTAAKVVPAHTEYTKAVLGS